VKKRSESPLITVITVVLNDHKNISQTIESVINQSFNNFEYIIIDGGSTDGTLNIINKYNENIDLLISEPDNGIYDAMNKGINLSYGKYIYFLNSGDRIIRSTCFYDLLSLLRRDPDILYGNINLNDSNNAGKIQNHKSFTRFNLLKKTICHQAIFFKKEVFDEIGKFNLEYTIKSDYEWLLRYYFNKDKKNVFQIQYTIADYLTGGFSFNNEKDKSEKVKILNLYYSNAEILIYHILNLKSLVKKI